MAISEAEMMADLQAADAAGDTELAQHIAGRIKAARGPQAGAVLASVPPTGPSRLESGVRGLVQGGTLGFSDEARGLVGGAGPVRQEPSLVVPKRLLVSPKAYAENFDATRPDLAAAQMSEADRAARSDAYVQARDAERAKDEAAQAANPGTYLAGQVAGATLPTLAGAAPLTGGRAMTIAAGQGAAQGAGYSDASSVRGLAGDTALGAGLGLAGYGAGQVVGKGAAALGRKAGEKLGLASARAGAQAAGEVTEDLATKAGQLGAETQKGSRYVENLMRLRESLTPAQLAEYEKLVAAGIVPDLQRAVAQGTLEALPGQAGAIAAKRGALTAAQQGAGQATAARAGELLKPSAGADTKSFLKSYVEPIVWALGAQQAGEAIGLDPAQQGVLAAAAGVVGGRTRAGKALWTRINRPGNQAALAEAMKRAADRTASLQRPVAAGMPAALIAALTGENQ